MQPRGNRSGHKALGQLPSGRGIEFIIDPRTSGRPNCSRKPSRSRCCRGHATTHERAVRVSPIECAHNKIAPCTASMAYKLPSHQTTRRRRRDARRVRQRSRNSPVIDELQCRDRHRCTLQDLGAVALTCEVAVVVGEEGTPPEPTAGGRACAHTRVVEALKNFPLIVTVGGWQTVRSPPMSRCRSLDVVTCTSNQSAGRLSSTGRGRGG